MIVLVICQPILLDDFDFVLFKNLLLGCFREPWERLYHSKEQYCLKYESKYLLELGRAFTKIATTALSVAAVQALQTTMLAGILYLFLFNYPHSILKY